MSAQERYDTVKGILRDPDLTDEEAMSRLQAIAKTVLAYRPPEKQKATKRREKRKRQRDAKKD
jgi:hypothetical protein